MCDFNGHIGFLGPQSLNKNGDIMLDLIDKNIIIILNGHQESKGEILGNKESAKAQ